MNTVLHRLAKWSEQNPGQIAQRFKQNGQWKEITVREVWERTFHLALFLESKGFTREDIGVIFSYNCPQWVHMDLAPLLLGARSCGIYPNSSYKDIEYILTNTSAKVLCVQNAQYFKRVLGEGGKVPESVKLIVTFDSDASFSHLAMTYEDALKVGRGLATSKRYQDYLNRIDPLAPAFLIYTSGTTGNPKGAMLSHDNLVFTSDMALAHFNPPKGATLFSFLPLCHVAEKLQNIGVGISGNFTVNYCTGIDYVARELPEVKPVILLCVPRLWEKMVEGVENKLGSAPPIKKKLAEWAFAVAHRVMDAEYSGKTPALADQIQFRLADKIILSKVRAALGLDQVKMAASGAAALSAGVEKWFRCLGINIVNTFGQTESTGIITMATPKVDCAGTIGRPAPGTEFRIAEDGEILSKGRHVFVGYYKNDQATQETIKDGWLHTGDLGVVDDRGLIVIRGRKKEIMKTSGGKMVAPLPIEEKLKESPLISQVCMVGDGRKYFSALVTLSQASTTPPSASNSVVKDQKIEAEVKKVFDQVNATLASYEQIKRFTVLAREFSVDSGEMTPTMKIKRNVIEANYSEIIEKMYG